jgi:hypothetical protein
MAWNEEEKIITVEQVNELYPCLGIPHFQRGSVWGNESVSALLESLLLNTPCGSFVFWKSTNNRENGVPLVENEKREIKYLIVDGQQRIRSIHDVFHDVDEDYTENNGTQQAVQDDSEYSKKRRVWCLNLTRVPELTSFLEPHGKEYSMFVFTTDPRYADNKSPLKFNIVPLLPLLAKDKSHALELLEKCIKHKAGFSKNKVDEGLIKLFERLTEMLSREFFVTVKDPTDSLADIVNLYNRINVGGKKVEAEERAFARLVAMNGTTWSQIASIFELVHGEKKDRESDLMLEPEVGNLRRDEVLKRQREHLFGFKLFIRTFIQVCNYHFNQPIGASSFSFSLVERKLFNDNLGHGDPAKVMELWQITREVITSVREVLKDELYCDDLVFLPETFCLVPLFQFLIQYPGLRESQYRKLLGWYALLLLLSELSTREVLGLASKIQQGSGVAFELIPEIMHGLDRKVMRLLKKQMVLKEASSIQNRYVLLLYWLLRKNEARDFSYKNLTPDKQTRLRPGHELKLGATVHPEKQHIVPFSQLRKKLRDNDAQRGSSHRFNNIGNLTYISRILNHYETGLSDDFVNLQYDSDEMLSAHFLWNDFRKASVQKTYEIVRRAFAEDSKLSADQASRLYDAFSGKRRDLIAISFEQWLNQLEKESLEQLGFNDFQEFKTLSPSKSRQEADVPIFVRVTELKPTQRIRLFGYEDLVEDKLVAFATPFQRKRFIVTDDFMEMKLTERKYVWLRLDKNGVSIHFEQRVSDALKQDILATLNMRLGEDQIYQKGTIGTVRVINLSKTIEKVHELEKEIEINIKKRVVSHKAEEKGSFEKAWIQRHGSRAFENLHMFIENTASLENPEIDVRYNNYGRPFLSLKIKGQVIRLFRPKTYEPSVCDELHKIAKIGSKHLEAVKTFRRNLCNAGIGRVFGKQNRIEIQLPIEPEKFKQLSGYLQDLSRYLAEAMEL